MAMRADMRFWTAIVMIGFCGFAVARGWSILQFSRALANVDRRRSGRRLWVRGQAYPALPRWR